MPAAASEGVAFACKEDRLHQKCATKLLKSHSTKLRPIGNNWFGPQEYNTAAACHIATRLLVTSNTATPHGELKVSLAPLELFLLLPGKKIGTQQGTSSSKNSNPNEYSTILWHTLLSVAVRAIDMRIHDLTCLDCRSKNWTQIVASTSAPAACGAADALCRRAGCLDRPQPKPPLTT